MVYRLAAPRAGTASVIILHGLGDSGHGWEFLAREAQQRPALSHVNFVLPSAPARAITAANGERMPAWFDLAGLGAASTDRFTRDAVGIKESLEYVKGLVSAEVDRGIARERIVVGGFSQGGALTMALAATYDQRLAGLLSMSGFLTVPDVLAAHASVANRDTPFLLTHGTADAMVPIRVGRASHEALRTRFGLANTTFEEYRGMQHTVDLECLQSILAFLERVLS